MTDEPQSLSQEIDKMHRQWVGAEEPVVRPSPKEAADARAAREDADFERLALKPERRAELARLTATKKALKSAVMQMRHGHVVDAEDRQKLVDEAAAALGNELSATQREAIVKAVNTAADAIAGGDRISGTRAADAAVEVITQDSGRITEVLPEVESPSEIVKNIERM